MPKEPTPLPQHLRPESCYVCGRGEHARHVDHTYWSNADAEAFFEKQFVPSYSPEAAYVAQHRPY